VPTYPVDIDPEQVVRWIRAEREVAPAAFRITLRRATEAKEIPVGKETHLGDEEREDLSEIATLATLEIAPAHAGDGWLLTVVVEDEAGPRIPDNGTVEAEREIDLETFYREFIRPGRGNASVVAEADSPEAEARMALLLKTIERGRHSPGAGRKGH
jgi:hypothetical protein